MAFEVYWLDETDKKIIYFEVIGRWHWREFDDALAQVEAMLMQAEASPQVDMLFDITRMSLLPVDFARRCKSDYLLRETPVHCVAVLGADDYIRVIWSVLRKLVPKVYFKVIFVESIEEALVSISGCGEEVNA